MIGTTISRYDILEELGQGGMSVVYLAQDTGLNRQVAVKLLHSHLANKPENRKRFRREAEAIARLRHENILDVYDVSDASEPRSYIVMEYVEGMNLRQFVEYHGAPPSEIVCLLGAQLCNALSHAHKQGVIHRDLKPENVMISTAGAVKLMDFGIAHVIGAETMTRTGSLIGSPAHMAPEMIDGAQVDARADIFALGTILYWMGTGRLPFCGDNTPQVLRNVMESRYARPEDVEPTLSHDLARIIERTLHTDPAERFQSADALKLELLAAVHAVGLEDHESMLSAYFSGPKRYGADFPAMVVPKLIDCAKRSNQRGSTAVAISYFNRVLAYDPGNEEVRECLRNLHRGRRIWLGAAAAVALCLVAGGAWAGYSYWDGVQRREAAAALTQRTLEDATTNARVMLAQNAAQRGVREAHAFAYLELPRLQAGEVARGVAAQARAVTRTPLQRFQDARAMRQISKVKQSPTRIIKERVQLPLQGEATSGDATPGEATDGEKTQVKTTPVEFKVFPPPTRLEIDGKPVSWQFGAVELTPGKHLLSASAPGCKPYRRFMVVNADKNDKIPVVLDWQDAHIRVESNKNVLVYVDSEPNPRSNGTHSSIRVPFERGKFYAPKTLNLRIKDSANLQRVQTREIEVEPGNTRVIKVNFP
ncbi:serine/threonine protein kinase [Bradymonas sediminis]|uniref:non-specific serine/threonine protein kinase n=1 Tax=Bradymonas sediminis TaxID=1548548 RepID=A0A2Z4FLM1_9DELT|nr:serine/threonine-protein kinase [Bradymonas sediminis]AWV89584.1 hypothetical protein DN745_09640 [Bradymonas sediminis]TDP76681.1 serine/threonine-protein kinase [Bradymonas sediminis]